MTLANNHHFTGWLLPPYPAAMTYDLYIGDRMFSSWSLRGWLMFEKFAIPHNTHMIGLYSGTMA